MSKHTIIIAAIAGLVFALVPAAQAAPPAANRVFWVAADTNVTTSGSDVTQWADAGTAANWVDTVVGAPQLTTATFPIGTRDVIRFDGNDGFNLLNDATARVNPISIYAVASIDAGIQSAILVSNFGSGDRGFGLGISDGTEERVKWYTALSRASFEPAIGDLTPETNYLLTATYGAAAKGLTVQTDVSSASASTTINGLTYVADTQFALGNLVGVAQFWEGDIAEILIYSAVDSNQDTLVQNYLIGKYFIPEPATLALLGIGGIGILMRRKRR